MSYHYENLQESTYPDLSLLFKQVFGRDFSPEYLKRKYDTSYTGEDSIGVMARDPEGRPAAWFGILPFPFEMDGTPYLGGQVLDCMSHADHRRKGLLQACAQRCIEQAKAKDWDFLYALPNQILCLVFEKGLKWPQTDQMQAAQTKAALLPIKSLMQRLRSNEGLPADDAPGIAPISPVRNGLIGLKTQDWFRYKQGFSFLKVQEFQRGKAILKAKGSLEVGELFPNQAGGDAALLEEILQYGRKKGFRTVICQSTFLPEALSESKWKVFPTWKVFAISFRGELSMDKLKLSLADLDTF